MSVDQQSDKMAVSDDNPEQALLAINTIRTLAIDAVARANSGHAGAPMGLAPVAYTLWQGFLNYDPADPSWPNRDRFVLSVGHASMLLYAMLHLTGVIEIDRDGKPTGAPAVSLDDIKKFRQLDSKCPGHPEYGITTGVETTTGPLGQGAANSVGMAIAERWFAARYNRPELPIFNHRVFAFLGDGDMMEGVASEAASIAGFLKLSNLIWVYDSNRVTIEGHTDLTFGEDVGTRFLGYGWNVYRVGDANDLPRLRNVFQQSLQPADRPSLIIVDSHIGYGAPKKQDTSAAHSEPLGADEARAAKRFYGWSEDAEFLVPSEVPEYFTANFAKRGSAARAEWQDLFRSYQKRHPAEAKDLDLIWRSELPSGWDSDLPRFDADEKGIASRDASGKVLNAIAAKVPWVMGGAADLAPSTKTKLTFDGAGNLTPETPGGRNVHFGVREHAMGAICNGLALSKLRSFGSGFLIFSDYMRPPIRLSALMEIGPIFIFTHDSIGVGEDGPTHQPIEQLPSLRAIPGMVTLRPADANEVTEAWRVIMAAPHRPHCLILSRQNLPTLDRQKYAAASGVAKGAYILAETKDKSPEVILLGTGGDVSFCINAFETLAKEGIAARVVSMPSWELFEAQDETYRNQILPASIRARVSVEQAATLGWDRYTGANGAKIGMHSFGSSAPIKDVLHKFGFSPDAIVKTAKQQIAYWAEQKNNE